MLLALLLVAAPTNTQSVNEWMTSRTSCDDRVTHCDGTHDFFVLDLTAQHAREASATRLAARALALLEAPDARADQRERAATVLGWLQWEAAIPALDVAAEHGNLGAVHALGFFGNREKIDGFIVGGGRYARVTFPVVHRAAAFDALLAALKRGPREVQRQAVTELRFFDDPRIDEAHRLAAAACLSEESVRWLDAYAPDERLELLARCSSTGDEETRAAALTRLVALRGAAAERARLLEALDGPVLVFVAAHRALSQLEGHVGTPPLSSHRERALLTAMWRKKYATQ